MQKLSWLGICICLLSLGVLLFSFWKPEPEEVVIPFTASNGLSGQFTLSLPTIMNVGEVATFRVRVNADPDLSVNQMVFIEGRFEVGAEEISPPGEIRIGIQTDQPVDFLWQVRTARESIYKGNLWLFNDSNGKKELLLGREVQISSRLFFGMTASILRVVCAFGILIGVFIFFMSNPKILIKSHGNFQRS